MNTGKIIRAWKDPAFRESLTPEERAQLPAHPAGMVELSDAQLQSASGALESRPTIVCTWYCTLTCTYTNECPTAFCTLDPR